MNDKQISDALKVELKARLEVYKQAAATYDEAARALQKADKAMRDEYQACVRIRDFLHEQFGVAEDAKELKRTPKWTEKEVLDGK